MSNIDLANKLNKLYRYFSVIPTAYDDSLSYYEQICAVLKLVLETLEQYQSTLEEAKQYTDSKIEELDIALKTFINNSIKNIITLINAVESKLNEHISDNEKSFNEIADEFNKVYFSIQNSIENNNEYLLEEISKNLSGQLLVTNFFTGQRVTIQNMLDYLANLHVENGITYAVLVERNYTYTELTALNISYTQMVINGNTLIPEK